MSCALAIAMFLAVPAQVADGARAKPDRPSRPDCPADRRIGCEPRPPWCRPALISPGFGRFPALGYVHSDTIVHWEFVRLPGPFAVAPGPFDPFAPVPFTVWDPAFVRPPVPPLRPGQDEPRGSVRVVPPTPVRAGTTDIPEELIEDFLPPRRATLSQRAQSARLEAAGDVMFRGGHYTRAAERYQQAISYVPDSDEARFKRAAALIAASNYAEALRVIRDALRSRPDWPFVAHDLLALFPDADAVDKVLDQLDRQEQQGHSEVDARFLRGYVLYFAGRRDDAAPIFQNPPAGIQPSHYEAFQRAFEQR